MQETALNCSTSSSFEQFPAKPCCRKVLEQFSQKASLQKISLFPFGVQDEDVFCSYRSYSTNFGNDLLKSVFLFCTGVKTNHLAILCCRCRTQTFVVVESKHLSLTIFLGARLANRSNPIFFRPAVSGPSGSKIFVSPCLRPKIFHPPVKMMIVPGNSESEKISRREDKPLLEKFSKIFDVHQIVVGCSPNAKRIQFR